MDGSGKILVIRFSSLGDMVLLTSLFELLAMKMPDYTLDLATKDAYAPIFEGRYPPGKVFRLEEKGIRGLVGLRRILARQRYDYIIDAHNVIRSNILYHSLGAGGKVQLRKDQLKKTLLIKQGENLYDRTISQIDRYLDLVSRLGIEIEQSATKLAPSAGELEVAESIVTSSGIDGKIIVAVAPGARWETKRWPVESFRSLLGLLSGKGYATVLIGDNKETELCRSIAGSSGQTVVACGKLSIMETAALLSISDALVTNDSAALHISEAVGTPVVAMFGPTVREFGYYPSLPTSKALEIDLDCRPCSRNGSRPCRLERKLCLESIQPGEVADAVDEIMRTSGVLQ
jgi:heptosyltransferase-2